MLFAESKLIYCLLTDGVKHTLFSLFSEIIKHKYLSLFWARSFFHTGASDWNHWLSGMSVHLDKIHPAVAWYIFQEQTDILPMWMCVAGDDLFSAIHRKNCKKATASLLWRMASMMVQTSLLLPCGLLLQSMFFHNRSRTEVCRKHPCLSDIGPPIARLFA